MIITAKKNNYQYAYYRKKVQISLDEIGSMQDFLRVTCISTVFFFFETTVFSLEVKAFRWITNFATKKGGLLLFISTFI